ncbi:VWA domain-containing protein [Frankia sp. CNm7]|uniref:VWA domain-containing protein n=1 Tax=Frankia nepalensis TaxID=1836974 RepID=A0A937RIP8_9ACTN|nr:VWA domain-containing protein [Frankia nepalensis]MBL7501643.1 VWA domain-containing protein [Frankia nepalensis]MBL7513373.1 VWA domain-containing protein [Frankia nepalensis]MBL7523016.1 VWA domain-containing protein [Frankia nepalensis]MBL7628074.1 VWA domain-containing protein [Frankia nepalensis]
MTEPASGSALWVEQRCSLAAVAFSEGRRQGARLVSGERRTFGLGAGRSIVNVPHPAPLRGWTVRTLTCGIAMQCSPSKDRIAGYLLHKLTPRELRALALVEGGVAMGWIGANWPGLMPELRRVLPDLEVLHDGLDGPTILECAVNLARSHHELTPHPLLGQLSMDAAVPGGLAASARRRYGRVPWSTRRKDSYRFYAIPVGGEGGVKNPNIPPPSRPEEEDVEVRPDARVGVPYPEWNFWTQQFLPDHVAVLERRHPTRPAQAIHASADVRRWFEEHTHRALRNRLEDGSDLDIDAYVSHHVATAAGDASAGRVFRDLRPGQRDVSTALLLDGSSSMGAQHGLVFRLELACADALSAAMVQARERHGVFVFSGSTRHRVEVRCLKDFSDRRFVAPSGLGLVAGGYTRLGAPLRHLTNRLLAQPSERRLLIVIGDGLMSDEGYEGRYAWADVAHAVEEAEDAGVSMYYLGVGRTRVDPLPEVFGPRRSRRILRVEELPRALAHVHRELVAA